MTNASATLNESSPSYAGWRVVGSCFLVALSCWGFGLYGHGVYLTELHRLYGWPTAAISAGITGFYLATAAIVVFIGDAINRFGPKRVMLAGSCCFVAAVALIAVINALWQLYAVYLLMAVGAASMHVGAISTVVGLWFDKKRPLAISLALNGASSGGVLIAPLLVMALVLFPAVALWIGRPDAAPLRGGPSPAVSAWTRGRALKSAKFWSVTAPCAMGLTAQVGFLVHQIPAFEPIVGRAEAALSVAVLTIAAILGRFGLGTLAHRFDIRRVAAWSMASQALALLVLAGTTHPAAMLASCALFGLSAGNLLTLPALIMQREFEPGSFATLVALSWAISQFTYAFGPGALGVIRDATGAYTLPLTICAALDIAAAAMVLWRPARA